MARKKSEQPAYQYHMSGQAKVRLDGKDFYLGKHGTPESYARYYSLLAEYNANGKKAPGDSKSDQPTHQADTVILVSHITADFVARVVPKYDHNDGLQKRYKSLCDLLDDLHGSEPADEFGPRKLESVRDSFVAKGNCRKYANELTRNVVRIIEHGVRRELVNAERIVALRSLPPLKRGEAKDNPGRKPASLEAIKATLPHLTITAAAMVRLQVATAMRPSEIFRMTPSMIDRSGPVWFYRPDMHKTEHHGKTKAVPILGDALEALSPYLFGDANDLCFRTKKGTPWNKDSYRIAITRAAKAAKVEHWTPYQIRRTTGQVVRDSVGPEAAQALYGHSRLATTEIYTKASEAKAIEAAKAAPRIG